MVFLSAECKFISDKLILSEFARYFTFSELSDTMKFISDKIFTLLSGKVFLFSEQFCLELVSGVLTGSIISSFFVSLQLSEVFVFSIKVSLESVESDNWLLFIASYFDGE